jgi:hypothetical protein
MLINTDAMPLSPGAPRSATPETKNDFDIGNIFKNLEDNHFQNRSQYHDDFDWETPYNIFDQYHGERNISSTNPRLDDFLYDDYLKKNSQKDPRTKKDS